MTDTKAGRDPEGALKEIEAQAETGAAPPASDKLCVFCKKPMGDEPAPPDAVFGLHRRCK